MALYRCLIAAMVAGHIVWGIAEIILLGLTGSSFTWQMFLAGEFLNAIPGIVLQLVFIHALMVALDKTGIVNFRQSASQGVKAN